MTVEAGGQPCSSAPTQRQVPTIVPGTFRPAASSHSLGRTKRWFSICSRERRGPVLPSRHRSPNRWRPARRMAGLPDTTERARLARDIRAANPARPQVAALAPLRVADRRSRPRRRPRSADCGAPAGSKRRPTSRQRRVIATSSPDSSHAWARSVTSTPNTHMPSGGFHWSHAPRRPHEPTAPEDGPHAHRAQLPAPLGSAPGAAGSAPVSHGSPGTPGEPASGQGCRQHLDQRTSQSSDTPTTWTNASRVEGCPDGRS